MFTNATDTTAIPYHERQAREQEESAERLRKLDKVAKEFAAAVRAGDHNAARKIFCGEGMGLIQQKQCILECDGQEIIDLLAKLGSGEFFDAILAAHNNPGYCRTILSDAHRVRMGARFVRISRGRRVQHGRQVLAIIPGTTERRDVDAKTAQRLIDAEVPCRAIAGDREGPQMYRYPGWSFSGAVMAAGAHGLMHAHGVENDGGRIYDSASEAAFLTALTVDPELCALVRDGSIYVETVDACGKPVKPDPAIAALLR